MTSDAKDSEKLCYIVLKIPSIVVCRKLRTSPREFMIPSSVEPSENYYVVEIDVRYPSVSHYLKEMGVMR